MDKLQLRKSTIMTLKNISGAEKRSIERGLTEHLLKSSLWQSASQIGVTVAQGFEWDTEPIIKAAWQQNKRVCVPKCNPEKKEMIFYHLQHFDQLESVYFNLREPDPVRTVQADKKQIDLLIVPGIVFDRRGYRIGFGGGYYDRFLTDFAGETASLASVKQIVSRVPADAFDIPVKHLITENGTIEQEG